MKLFTSAVKVDTQILQDSVATYLRLCGKFYSVFLNSLSLNVTVKYHIKILYLPK